MSPTGFAILLGFAILFYRVAENEGRSGVIWASISAFACVVATYFHLGLLGLLGGQVATYLALWIVNFVRPKIHDT
ncbi:MAG: hypothetical protein AAGD22_07180 [Verrucomicrobiota bacterium]